MKREGGLFERLKRLPWEDIREWAVIFAVIALAYAILSVVTEKWGP